MVRCAVDLIVLLGLAARFELPSAVREVLDEAVCSELISSTLGWLRATQFKVAKHSKMKLCEAVLLWCPPGLSATNEAY